MVSLLLLNSWPLRYLAQELKPEREHQLFTPQTQACEHYSTHSAFVEIITQLKPNCKGGRRQRKVRGLLEQWMNLNWLHPWRLL